MKQVKEVAHLPSKKTHILQAICYNTSLMKSHRHMLIRNVAVVINLVGASGRNLLTGVSRQARKLGHWRIHLFKSAGEFSEAALAQLEAEGLDGVIVSDLPGPEVVGRIEASEVPLVVIGMRGAWFRERRSNIIFVRNDDEEIGRLGARHLLAQGTFGSFGFVPCHDRRYWSLLRQKGFRAELRRAGADDVRVYRRLTDVQYAEDIPALAGWLAALPKSAAIMGAYDDSASGVLTAAAEAGIAVPQQLNVLGVDNDELLCDFTDPPLTSIEPDHEAIGARAARELARLMAARQSSPPATIRVRAMRVVLRSSTGFATPSARIVERAIAFIEKNAARPLTPETVVRELRVSRRLADLRFHERGGATLAEAISKARLALVAKRLVDTGDSITLIAKKLSFPNVNSLANRFRARYGLSMREWRKRKRRR